MSDYEKPFLKAALFYLWMVAVPVAVFATLGLVWLIAACCMSTGK
jgi:hypothetical protein